ncbi:hypothetical protein G7046_g3872 [Stylonectria norvegica]|nr:hypothetical protein G7046_g3872 [Stylonectria norvegica]
MATLETLKHILRRMNTETGVTPTFPLSEDQYSAGFDILSQGSGQTGYRDFIIPQLSLLLASLDCDIGLSVLEIGPGPRSVLEHVPEAMRRKLRRYAAFEPNGLFAASLEESICSTSKWTSVLPCLEAPPNIHRKRFGLPVVREPDDGGMGIIEKHEKFDVILFCHSMYGMKPKRTYIERALQMLTDEEPGRVVVFHRESLNLDGLVCRETISFPIGFTFVEDADAVLDNFASFLVGFATGGGHLDVVVRSKWRETCRTLGRREKARPGYLMFSSPETMVTLTKHATTLPELTALLPPLEASRAIKNRQACFYRPAAIVRPKSILQVHQCVRWALKYFISLSVVGGGHSENSLRSNVVSVDMGAFDQIYFSKADGADGKSGLNNGLLAVVESGCKTGCIIDKTMARGVTIPLGARPSVGAGLWLQGGIGHLTRLHGLACDAIIGAVVVSVDSGQILCVGCVPSRHLPPNAVRPANHDELLWAIKGAGTNFGIVVSVTFRTYAAAKFLVRNWVVPLRNSLETQLKLSSFNKLAAKLPRNCSADAYLFSDSGQLHLGVTAFEAFTTVLPFGSTVTPTSKFAHEILGPGEESTVVDGLGLFETEMYMSRMHGGHGGAKTSSFKRCLFLKDIGSDSLVDVLVEAVKTRPLPLCYLHLLQGGGAVRDVAAEDTAFGCRDWDFACVITGVWPRDKDETEVALSAIEWVYDVVKTLSPLSAGAYGADLGPDPRDAPLAAAAFGPNLGRLARLKHCLDPRNLLAYACPLPKAPKGPQLIILVTGESGAGKDYCAKIWESLLTTRGPKALTARVASISDVTKREYAKVTGANLNRLLGDRAYKEQMRPKLTAYFQDQVRQRPGLPQEHFLDVVHGATDVDVLLITGMRDAAPVAEFSHLVSEHRLLEIYVQASDTMRRIRRGDHSGVRYHEDKGRQNGDINPTVLDYCPSLVFDNNETGNAVIEDFAKQNLFPFFHPDLQRLTGMVRVVHNFPSLGVEFRHVLDICQQPGGLNLCTSLLQTHFNGDWSKVNNVVSCEAGGFVYASALALRQDLPLALIRNADKLPPPCVSVTKSPSNISSVSPKDSQRNRIELGRGVISIGASVVVVDDVFATGETLCAVLELLSKVGVKANNIRVMVIAEFPVHRGRARLQSRGFGVVPIQSLLVFDGT